MLFSMLVFFENTSREKSIFCIFGRNTIRILFLFRHVPVDEASSCKPLHKNGNAKGAFFDAYVFAKNMSQEKGAFCISHF